MRDKIIEPDRIEKAGELCIAGIGRKYVAGHEAASGIPAQWQEFSEKQSRIPGEEREFTFGLCSELNSDGQFEYLCGKEVTKGDALPGGFSRKVLPENKYAVFIHRGHVSGIQKTCDDIAARLRDSDYKKPENTDIAMFERYGRSFDPQTSSGAVEIWVPVL